MKATLTHDDTRELTEQNFDAPERVVRQIAELLRVLAKRTGNMFVEAIFDDLVHCHDGSELKLTAVFKNHGMQYSIKLS